jgi:hypothetical protein
MTWGREGDASAQYFHVYRGWDATAQHVYVHGCGEIEN